MHLQVITLSYRAHQAPLAAVVFVVLLVILVSLPWAIFAPMHNVKSMRPICAYERNLAVTHVAVWPMKPTACPAWRFRVTKKRTKCQRQ